MDEKVQELLRFVKKALLEQTQKLLAEYGEEGVPVEVVRKRFTELLLDMRLPPEGAIDFEVVPFGKDRISIAPKNLFTGLLLAGIVVPYAAVEDRTEFEHEGVKYKLMEDGSLGVAPSTAVECITITIKEKWDDRTEV